jgi:hypothetical protein
MWFYHPSRDFYGLDGDHMSGLNRYNHGSWQDSLKRSQPLSQSAEDGPAERRLDVVAIERYTYERFAVLNGLSLKLGDVYIKLGDAYDSPMTMMLDVVADEDI